MDAETDQYAPELVRDNTPIDAPGGYADGYHLTDDLTDQAIRFIADHAADAPQTPWLTWLAFGACHAPHQAPRGAHPPLRHRLRRRLGRRARAAPRPPEGDGDRAGRTPACRRATTSSRPWDEHSADEKRLFTRLQAAFAAMLDHADQHLARLVAFLDESGAARRHPDPGAVRQWRQPGGRAAGHGQRHGPLQRHARADGGEDRAHRRHRRARHPLELSAGLGDGLQHAAEALQAEHPRRRHPRSAGGLLAGGSQSAGRAAPPVSACVRCDPHRA